MSTLANSSDDLDDIKIPYHIAVIELRAEEAFNVKHISQTTTDSTTS